MSKQTNRAENGVLQGKGGIALLLVALAVFAAAIVYRTSGAGEEALQVSSDPSAPPSIDQLKRAAEASADDAGPWQKLGFAHFQRGEFAQAATAYERAVAIDDDEAVLWSALGEARVMASERDPMPPEAFKAFERASVLNPGDPRARYFLNVQKDLDGDHAGAIAGWLALLAETPKGAPWESDLIRTIEQVGTLNQIEVQSRIDVALNARPGTMAGARAASRGPSQAEIAAAGAIPPSEQRAMAEEMVERLEQRLIEEPSDLAGWVMLMRSRMTLGQSDRARQALEQAISANPGEASQLRSEAKALGLR